MNAGDLPLADQVCLAIIGEAPTHGWELVKLLAPGGELGRIWSLSRPLTYRSIERLVEFGLVERTAVGRRSDLHITRSGTRRRQQWLNRPVAHLRDLRTEFLLKIALRERSGLDSTDLFERQRARLEPAISALTDHEPGDSVERWRHESALAARRFLSGRIPVH